MSSALAILCYCLAAFLCLLAGRAQRARDRRRLWFIIAAVQIALGCELVARIRLRLGTPVRALLVREGAYQDRQFPQQLMLLAATAAFAVIGYMLWRWLWLRRHDNQVVIAAGASMSGATIFIVEAVSLHQLDAFLNRKLGPISLYGAGWIACALAVAGAAALALGRSQMSRRRQR